MTYITLPILSIIFGIGFAFIFIQLHPRHRNLKREEAEIESRRIQADRDAEKKANDLYNKKVREIQSKENDLNSRIVDVENQKAEIERKRESWKTELKNLQHKSSTQHASYAQLKKDIKKAIDILDTENPNIGYALRILNKAYKRKLYKGD